MTTAVLAFVAVVALAAANPVEMLQVPVQPRRFTFGWPIEWISQESSATPPVPYSVGLANPMDNATNVRWGALALNVLAIWAILCALVCLRPNDRTPEQHG